LTSNYGEFAIIKIRIEDGLPDSKELHCITVTKPIGYEEVPVLGPEHIRERDVITFLERKNRDGCPPHCDGGCFGFFHALSLSLLITSQVRSSNSAGAADWVGMTNLDDRKLLNFNI
jgi:hypothetical protein